MKKFCVCEKLFILQKSVIRHTLHNTKYCRKKPIHVWNMITVAIEQIYGLHVKAIFLR